MEINQVGRVLGMIMLIIPNYQVVPSTVSTSRQDVIAVSYDPLLHWVSNVMEEIPEIGVTIVNMWTSLTCVIPSTSDFNDSIC